MKNYFYGAITAIFLLIASDSAEAAAIDISARAPGLLLPSLSSASVLTFDDLPVGGLPSYQFNGGALAGSGAIEDTTIIGKSAQPAGDATQYLTVSYPSAAGGVTLTLSSPENYFGLYWGSLDSYNSITFLKGEQQLAAYSGADIAALTELGADGNQQSALSNRYIEFDLGAVFYDAVILSTTGYGFEVDNLAFGDPPVPVSEPGAPMMLGASLGLLALTRRGKPALCPGP